MDARVLRGGARFARARRRVDGRVPGALRLLRRGLRAHGPRRRPALQERLPRDAARLRAASSDGSFTLDFGAAIPDLDYLLDGFHLDPDNDARVWFTLRYVGTNDGQATSIGDYELKPTGNRVRGGPEMHSLWWTPEKRIKWETVGYVGCKFTGTNEGFGGLAGLLIPLGVPRFVFALSAPFAKYLFQLSRFNEVDYEKGGRAVSPAADLPAWWHARTTAGVNVNR